MRPAVECAPWWVRVLSATCLGVGTMISSGSRIRGGMVSRIALAWVVTLPITIAVAAGLFYVLAR